MENERIEASSGVNMQKATQMLIDMAIEFCEKIYPTIEATISALDKFVRAIFKEIAPAFTNRKVIHLARHSKKARVRKKNINRVIKAIERGWKNGKGKAD